MQGFLAGLLAALALVIGGCSGSGPSAAAPKTFTDDDGPSLVTAAPPATPAMSAAATSPLAKQLAGVVATVAAQKQALAQPAIEQAMRAAGGNVGQSPLGGGASPTNAGSASVAGANHNWELQFPKGNTLEAYARQLDFFGIELGVLMPDNKIIYAYGLSKLKPDLRTGPADTEQRFYFSWKRGDLVQADHQLYQQAGVNTDGRVVVQFLPTEIEGLLVDLEKSHAGEKAAAVLGTRFGVRAKRNGFELIVLEQTYK